MKDEITALLANIKEQSIPFTDVIAFIEAGYQYTPTAFRNGETYNEATQNQGSAKVFAFAQLNNLSEEDTLSLFAEHYQSVMSNPDGTDHQNIRQFMAHGWAGIKFDGKPLSVLLG
jgi:hypothetical protein